MGFDVIFIAGPQGSGKGTQGKKLADKLDFFFLGMGSVLREIQAEDTPLSKKLSALDRGTLLPDDVIVEILEDRLAKIEPGRGIIFDGVPRRLNQAEFLISLLQKKGYKNMASIFIDLPREASIHRLISRAKIENRTDDTPEAIEMRFEYYDREMVPTLEYLKKETAFFEIDGTPSVDEVEHAIDTALGI